MIRIDRENPKGIVWLASYPKSGNTWVRVCLAALHELLSGNAPESIDINRLFSFSTEQDRVAHLFERHLSRPITKAEPAEIAALRPVVQEDIVRAADGIVFIKTHNAMIYDHGVPMINQGVSAGALYILRNPLDVAISFAHFRDVSLDQAITDMATPGFGGGWKEDAVNFICSSWSENVRSWTERRHSAVLVVRYEDLLARPVESFRQIANHMRAWPTDPLLHQAIDLSSFENLRKSERRSGFVEKPDYAQVFFRQGRAGQWREVLTPAQVDRIVDAHGEQMARFGYLPD